LQRGKREQQPSCDLPMAFAGDRLMIDEHRGSDVSKAMKQFPISSTEPADRPVVARERENYQDRQSAEAKPNKWLR
jgi:hypothetical protein